MRREASLRWKVLYRWTGERPADPGQDPQGHTPTATAAPSPVLGSPHRGPAVADLLDVAVEIPMVGSGASLNVAVAGSLVLYRLAGLI